MSFPSEQVPVDEVESPEVPRGRDSTLLSTLWLDAGPEFLREQHDALVASIVALQDAASDTVIDLRERGAAAAREITVRHRCHRHVHFRAHVRCRDCDLPFCNDCIVLIDAAGLPLCQDCALIAGGIRPSSRRPTA